MDPTSPTASAGCAEFWPERYKSSAAGSWNREAMCPHELLLFPNAARASFADQGRLIDMRTTTSPAASDRTSPICGANHLYSLPDSSSDHSRVRIQLAK